MKGGLTDKAVRVSLLFAVVTSVGLWPLETARASAQPGLMMTAAVGDIQLTAADALIMTGTDMHTVDAAWMQMAVDEFIRPALGGQYAAVPVETPEEFWPFGGIRDSFIDDSIVAGGDLLDAALADTLARNAQSGDPDAPIVVFGYSQSAVIATQLKRRLSEAVARGDTPPPVTFVVIGNLARPNGGIYARFAGQQLPGWTMSGATPTDTAFRTIDVARQYDFFADFPQDGSNLLAVANAAMGAVYAHGYMSVTLNPEDPRYNPGTVVQTYGDTTYYFIPAEHLPLLQPLWDLGVSPDELAAIEPELRALIEQGYDRSIPFGQPTEAETDAQLDPVDIRAALGAAAAVGRAAKSPPPAPAASSSRSRTKAPLVDRRSQARADRGSAATARVHR